jgi:hypothetical protein
MAGRTMPETGHPTFIGNTIEPEDSMRHTLIGLLTAAALGALTPAAAQVSFDFATPGMRISFNVPTYPNLVPIPGYPV